MKLKVQLGNKRKCIVIQNNFMVKIFYIFKKFAGQLSYLLFQASVSKHSGKVLPRSSQFFQASRFRQLLHIACIVVARQRLGIRIKD